VFVATRLFQSTLIFVRNSRSLISKYQSSVEVAKRPIYSKNYGRKKFCSAGPGPVYLFLTAEMFEN
jgi:hypothetical protein